MEGLRPIADDTEVSANPHQMTGEELLALFESKEFLAGYLKAKERERIRFSRELHDSIGQLLLALRLDVAKLASAPLSQLSQAVSDVQATLTKLKIRFVRSLSFIILPN